VCCSVLQCAAVCCCVLRRIFAHHSSTHGGDQTSNICQIFESPDWTVFLSTLLSDRDTHLLKFVGYFGESRENLKKLRGISKNLFEIMVVVIIFSTISSARGVSDAMSVLQCVAVYCSVLQCVAVCCNMLQYVAVCCSERCSTARLRGLPPL